MPPRPEAAEAGPGPLRIQIETLAVLGATSLPAFTPAAGATKLVFPAVALALAAYHLLSRGDLRRYVSLCTWLFVLAPFVRRVADLNSGWSQTSTILLAPYLCCALSLMMIPLAAARPRLPQSIGLLLVAAVAVYGLGVASLAGNLAAGFYDFLRWLVPPCFGVLVAVNAAKGRAIARDLGVLFALALCLTGLYGIAQFASVPAWDSFWMTSARMDSIGSPLPFEIRVFSTMHSPGSFAAFLGVAIVWCMCTKGRLRWIGMALGCAALGLTIVRAAWIGMAFSLAFLMVAAPSRVRGTALSLMIAGAVLAPAALATGEAGEVITDRLSSIGDLSADTSMRERMNLYSVLFDEMDENILGSGLGSAQTGQKSASVGRFLVVDGGPVEVVLSVGAAGAVLYYLGVLSLLAPLFSTKAGAVADREAVAAARCVAATAMLLQATGPSTVGEMGFFLWLAAGTGLALVRPAAAGASVETGSGHATKALAAGY